MGQRQGFVEVNGARLYYREGSRSREEGLSVRKWCSPSPTTSSLRSSA